MPHPIQDMFLDHDPSGYDYPRFRENKIVSFLLARGGFDLNDLAAMQFPAEDREQFAMLIGYSLGGFSELSYVSDETYMRAEAEARKLTPCPITPDAPALGTTRKAGDAEARGKS